MAEALRKCPTCDTPVDETVNLGLRNYDWLDGVLPGRVAPMDVDFMLERRGSFLVMENKPGRKQVPMGQHITLKAMRRMGMDVWVAWDVNGDGTKLEVGSMDTHGKIPFVEKMDTEGLGRRVRSWFDAASED